MRQEGDRTMIDAIGFGKERGKVKTEQKKERRENTERRQKTYASV